MKKKECKPHRLFLMSGILLTALGLLFPLITQNAWFNILFKVRKAISAGDSGHLILAAAYMSLLYALQSTCLFLGGVLVVYYAELKLSFPGIKTAVVFLLMVIVLQVVSGWLTALPWEPVTTILALILSLLIFERLFGETGSFIQVSIVSVQVFFAFQWLNIMPTFTAYHIGRSDLPFSIKSAGLYLEAASILNFVGAAFFLPFIFSSFVTATLFISYSKNLHMVRMNYEKEREIQVMKGKVLESRIYKEVNSLVHDLKTPLVTIRGLNSLLAVTKDTSKLEEYSGRIENSVGKMGEMISGFLYEHSRQNLPPMELVSYIRAQLPLEDPSIKIHMKIEEPLPTLYVNKIRMARALINILENAIVVPTKEACKEILFEINPVEEGLYMSVRDNGTGIKESDLRQIWEVGYSTNNTSGLGLPFAKQIIEDNEGTIEISSQPGKGTAVTIFLPSMERLLQKNTAQKEQAIGG
jgi:signal transduction histidine kinase